MKTHQNRYYENMGQKISFEKNSLYVDCRQNIRFYSKFHSNKFYCIKHMKMKIPAEKLSGLSFPKQKARTSEKELRWWDTQYIFIS